MVGGSLELACGHIDFSAAAFFSERLSCEYVIDAPPKISFNGVSIIIPIGVLDDARVKLSIDVYEPQATASL
jgi:hypothetical protein